MPGSIRTEKSPIAGNLTVFSKEQKKKGKDKAIRFAAYCRVSTDLACQQTSLENQMVLFKAQIEKHPGWILSDIYVDKGLTGTSAKSRSEFQRMIQDAAEGKIILSPNLGQEWPERYE
jgi:predicted site-specific integrase-resolvase